MPALLDAELDRFTRTIDLVEYAKLAGYEERQREPRTGLTFLEHRYGDRIVVGRNPDGQWIYASARAYEPARSNEPAERELERLRACVTSTRDKGTIVDFVVRRDHEGRGGEVGLEVVRQRLRDFAAERTPLDFYGALRLPAERTPERRSPGSELAEPGGADDSQARKRALGQRGVLEHTARGYVWRPLPTAPSHADREQRRPRGGEPEMSVGRKPSRSPDRDR